MFNFPYQICYAQFRTQFGIGCCFFHSHPEFKNPIVNEFIILPKAVNFLYYRSSFGYCSSFELLIWFESNFKQFRFYHRVSTFNSAKNQEFTQFLEEKLVFRINQLESSRFRHFDWLTQTLCVDLFFLFIIQKFFNCETLKLEVQASLRPIVIIQGCAFAQNLALSQRYHFH